MFQIMRMTLRTRIRKVSHCLLSSFLFGSDNITNSLISITANPYHTVPVYRPDFNSATTIYLSYSYNPVATNTNLRAVTLVYPCSGLNIDSTDVTDYRNLSTEVHVAS